MKPKDKMDALMKEQFEILSEMETSSNRKQVRAARQRLKHFIHKHDRDLGKRQIREQLTFEEECV